MSRTKVVAALGGVALLVGIGATAALAQQQTGTTFTVQQGTSTSAFGYVASSPASQDPTVTAEDAVRIAGGGEPQLVLAHVQWKPGNVDADAWLVTYPNTCTPLFGPGPQPGKETTGPRSNWAIGDATTVVDATTGARLFSFSSADQSKDASGC